MSITAELSETRVERSGRAKHKQLKQNIGLFALSEVELNKLISKVERYIVSSSDCDSLKVCT